jgi:hypothetical protein
MVRVGATNGRIHLWRPFTTQYAAPYATERHLYKNIPGNKLVFEEINHDLELTLRVAWRTGDRFGFVRTVWLDNNGDSRARLICLTACKTSCPTAPTSALQTTMSSLLHAYKRSELEPATGLGIFALSATLSDRAEPSESLKATVAWQVGLDNPVYLLSADQMAAFGNGRSLTPNRTFAANRGLSGQQHLHPGTQHRPVIGTSSPTSTRTARPLPGWPAFWQQDRAAIEQQIEADIAQNTDTIWSATWLPPMACSRPPSRRPPPTTSPTSCSTSCAAAFWPMATR